MVTVVVGLNVLISLLCLYVAWRLWKLRRALAAATRAITSAERSTYKVLHGAPRAIYRGQSGVQGLSERYSQLELQLQRVRQVLALLGLLQRIGSSTFQRRDRLSRSQWRRLQRLQRYGQ